MSSIFSKIIKGEIPSYKIAEDENYYAFLDINPLAKGHALVIPKQEVDKIWDLDFETYTGLMQFAYKVAHGIESAMPCLRVGMAVIGLEVPHVHIHLIPLNSMGDINFSQPKLDLEKSEMKEIAIKISKEVL